MIAMKKSIYILSTIFLPLIVLVLISSCTNVDEEALAEGTLTEFGEDNRMQLASAISNAIPEGDIVLYMSYGGVPVVVEATHELVDGCTTFHLDGNLRQGDYIVQYAQFGSETRSDASVVNLGCTLTVGESSNSVYPDIYNEEQYMFGEGTEKLPFIIASVYGFEQINLNIQNDINDTDGVSYLMIADIEMSGREDYTGVANDISTPFKGIFDGDGHTITCLEVDRDLTEGESSSSVGLFNYIQGASISNINIDAPIMSGHTGVGALVGCVVGDSATNVIASSIVNCSVTYSGEYNRTTSAHPTKVEGCRYVGALVGMVNEGASLYMDSCSNDSELSSGFVTLNETLLSSSETGYFGGLVGGAALSTKLTIYSCENNLDLNVGCGTALGGIVGCADSVYMTQSVNRGEIIAASSETFSMGGMVGSASNAMFTTCRNEGDVTGGTVVGGIIGSTLLGSDDEAGDSYGNVNASAVINTGAVSGYSYVGGVAAASHICMSDSYNSATVTSYDNRAGGLVGLAPILSAMGCNNSGSVYGNSGAAGGICGEVYYFVVGGSVNAGRVDCDDAAGGIIGVGGTCGAINYSANYGAITGSKSRTGGIAGALGDKEDDPEIGRFIFNTAVNVVFCGAGVAGEIFEENKVAKVVVKIVKGREAFKTAKELLLTAYETYEAVVENQERDEKASEIEFEMDSTCTEYMAEINSEMSQAIAEATYSGSIAASSSILGYSYNNIYDFQNYLSDDEDIAESYNTAINDDLQSIASSNAKAQEIVEIACAVLKCAVGIVSFAIELTPESKVKKSVKIGSSIGCTLGETVISAIDTWTDPGSFNVLSITQVSNFGSVSGSGLIGCSGDRIQIRQSLSAGSAGSYAIADRGDALQMVCQQHVCVGDDSRAITSDITYVEMCNALCYSSTGKSYYKSASYFSDIDTYDDYDLIDSDDENPMWALASGWAFALPYTNYYNKSFAPSTNGI